MDALNSSFLTPSIMPFLSELAKKNFRPVENVLGYSYAIQSCMLSGKYPCETNNWIPCFYSPENSPLLFSTLRKVKPFLILDKLPKFRYLALRQFRRFMLKKGVQSNNIPISIIDKLALYPYYYMCELPYVEGLSKSMEKNGMSFNYVGPPAIRNQIYSQLIRDIKSSNQDTRFILAYDDKLDFLGHRFGPYSVSCVRYAKSLDHVLFTVYQKLKKRFGHNFLCLFFSDHGQCEQRFTCDILTEFHKNGLKLGKDYGCFVDATLAFFWYENSIAKEKILEILGTVKMRRLGTIIDENRREHYHLNFSDNRYGKIIYVLKPGGTFFPNFFSPFGTLKGLHGYLPEENVQKSFLISDKLLSFPFNHVKDFRDFALYVSSNDW
ncbi:MAG: alkaline phosphatase family protein [Candidatus Bathyarchaeum tardum]|nr:MAG: alkaline phosphatase family protein [Candidatus Bathyarchaeum tardum]